MQVSVQRMYWSENTLFSVKQHLSTKCTSIRKEKKTNIQIIYRPFHSGENPVTDVVQIDLEN